MSWQLWVRILNSILWSHQVSGQAGEFLVPGYDGSECEAGDKSWHSLSFWLYPKAKCKAFRYYSVTLVFHLNYLYLLFPSQEMKNRELLELLELLYLPMSLPKISFYVWSLSPTREHINHNNKLLPCLPGSNETLLGAGISTFLGSLRSTPMCQGPERGVNVWSRKWDNNWKSNRPHREQIPAHDSLCDSWGAVLRNLEILEKQVTQSWLLFSCPVPTGE